MRPASIRPCTVERREIASIGADQNPSRRGRQYELGLIAACIHSGIERREYIESVTSQRRDQPVLSRVFVKVELHELGAKR